MYMKVSSVWGLIWSLQFTFAEKSYFLHVRHISSVGLGLPEYIGTWSLNDRIVLHCDTQSLLSVNDPSIPSWINNGKGIAQWKEMIFLAKVVQKYLKKRLQYTSEHGNLTGIYPHARIYQAHGYCRLHPNGTVSSSVNHGYNGKDFVSFDIEAKSWTTTVPQAVHYIENRATGAFDLDRLFNYYNYECPQLLKGILMLAPWINNELVPQVYIFKQRGPFTFRETLCCHVTGFYPKEVQVQWLGPDGLPLVDGVSSGEVLPNEDGSYQLRSSLQLPEEPQTAYSCVVMHSSVTGNITVTWEHPGRFFWRRAGSVVAAMCVVTVLLWLLVVSWWRAATSPEERVCLNSDED